MRPLRRYRTHLPRKHIARVAELLSRAYGDFAHYNKKNAFHELLFIICSIQTDSDKYHVTYRELRSRFPTMRSLQAASPRLLAQAIRSGGLSNQKATRIHAIIEAIRKERRTLSLAFLSHLPDQDVEAYLLSLPGVGLKTARCVMMYSLGRHVFPVDLHCWRIAIRLGWISPSRPDGSCGPADMQLLQDLIPSEHRFSLHVNMLSLGRKVCKPTNPQCTRCPVEHFCARTGVAPRATSHRPPEACAGGVRKPQLSAGRLLPTSRS